MEREREREREAKGSLAIGMSKGRKGVVFFVCRALRPLSGLSGKCPCRATEPRPGSSAVGLAAVFSYDFFISISPTRNYSGIVCPFP